LKSREIVKGGGGGRMTLIDTLHRTGWSAPAANSAANILRSRNVLA
jgi:hypothetical protein